MSEFFDAYLCKCPHCGKQFASCEGPLCDCLDRQDEAEEDEEDLEN